MCPRSSHIGYILNFPILDREHLQKILSEILSDKSVVVDYVVDGVPIYTGIEES